MDGQDADDVLALGDDLPDRVGIERVRLRVDVGLFVFANNLTVIVFGRGLLG